MAREKVFVLDGFQLAIGDRIGLVGFLKVNFNVHLLCEIMNSNDVENEKTPGKLKLKRNLKNISV